MKTAKDLKAGDRVLYRAANEAQLREGHFQETSPSGAYVNLGYGQWHRSDTLEIVEELKPFEPPTFAPQPTEAGPLKVIIVGPLELLPSAPVATAPIPVPLGVAPEELGSHLEEVPPKPAATIAAARTEKPE
jgi:hypothetical protein